MRSSRSHRTYSAIRATIWGGFGYTDLRKKHNMTSEEATHKAIWLRGLLKELGLAPITIDTFRLDNPFMDPDARAVLIADAIRLKSEYGTGACNRRSRQCEIRETVSGTTVSRGDELPGQRVVLYPSSQEWDMGRIQVPHHQGQSFDGAVSGD